jgi:hypothetical protein
LQPKGGNSIYLSCALVFLFGNQKSSGVSKLSATNKGRKVNFAIRTKVGIHKNHMNGLGYADNKILATTHGFIEDDKKTLTNTNLITKIIGQRYLMVDLMTHLLM